LITLASKLSAEQQQQKEGGLKAHQRIFETNQFILVCKYADNIGNTTLI
jgi:hypothetical protein